LPEARETRKDIDYSRLRSAGEEMSFCIEDFSIHLVPGSSVRGFLLMRISSVLLILLAIASLVAYRQPGSRPGRFFGGLFASVAYIIFAVLVLSAIRA